MQLIIDSRQRTTACAAKTVAELIASTPHCTLGLPAGGSQEDMYDVLCKERNLNWSGVVTFNLAEYVIAPTLSPPCRSYMEKNLFDKLSINDKLSIDRFNTHLLDSSPADPEALQARCDKYEATIRAFGGLDLCIVEIGNDGQLAFNEPIVSPQNCRTRLVALPESNCQANADFFGGKTERVPRLALTMGIGTILESRRILLTANGKEKADAVRDAIEGPLTSRVPASYLQSHPNVDVLLDEEAAGSLEMRKYHKEMTQAWSLGLASLKQMP